MGKQNNKKEVRWAEIAIRDLESITDYISQENPLNAQRIYQDIRQRAETLNQLSNRGRIVPELNAIGENACRELVISPYRLVYISTETRIFVLGVVDSRRDLEQLIFERIKSL